jgi:hypothetical protein
MAGMTSVCGGCGAVYWTAQGHACAGAGGHPVAASAGGAR